MSDCSGDMSASRKAGLVVSYRRQWIAALHKCAVPLLQRCAALVFHLYITTLCVKKYKYTTLCSSHLGEIQSSKNTNKIYMKT